jgi:hypothetical protein
MRFFKFVVFILDRKSTKKQSLNVGAMIIGWILILLLGFMGYAIFMALAKSNTVYSIVFTLTLAPFIFLLTGVLGSIIRYFVTGKE